MLHRFLKYLFRNQVIFAIFLIAFGWFLIQIRDIILSLFLSYIIMAAILPFVQNLRKRGFPNLLAVLIPYVGIFVFLFALVLSLVPFILLQIQRLAFSFPQYLQQTADLVGFHINSAQMQQYLTTQVDTLSKSTLDFSTKVFGGIFSLITIFIVSFYLLLYHDRFNKFVASLFQPHWQAYILTTLNRVNDKLGAWLRGQLVLSFFIGFMTYIALTILGFFFGFPYAIPLAILAGLLEVVPTLGPTLSAIPAVIVALTISPTLALTVVAIYILIQTLEGHLVVPKVMQKSVGLNPVVVILSILIGANLMGIAGALLAIPFVSCVIVLINSIEERSNTKAEN